MRVTGVILQNWFLISPRVRAKVKVNIENVHVEICQSDITVIRDYIISKKFHLGLL